MYICIFVYMKILHIFAANSAYFDNWDDRLSDFPEDEKYARLLLNKLSKSQDGASRSVLQSLIFKETNDADKAGSIITLLLKRLTNDGYLMFDTQSNKYVFRSPLLRDFWYNKFVR